MYTTDQEEAEMYTTNHLDVKNNYHNKSTGGGKCTRQITETAREMQITKTAAEMYTTDQEAAEMYTTNHLKRTQQI